MRLIFMLTMATIPFLAGCAGLSPYVEVPEKQAQSDGERLYFQQFNHEDSIASTVSVNFVRTSDSSGIYELELDGYLHTICASVLFPEEVRVEYPEVRHRYQGREAWFENKAEEPSKLGEALRESLAPANLPGHIPYGIGGSYRFMKKMASKECPDPAMEEHLENDYDSVDLAFMHTRRVHGFSLRVPVSGLEPGTRYETEVFVSFHDRFEERSLSENVPLEN